MWDSSHIHTHHTINQIRASHSRKQQLGTTLQLPVICSSCGTFATQLLASFSRNPLILHLSLSLHQLNTKPNTVKSHKVHGYNLKQLQHFLSWNKANIKHSCKSQLYTSFLSTTHFGIKVNQNQVNKSEVLKAVFRKFHVPNHFIEQNIEVNHINTENQSQNTKLTEQYETHNINFSEA